MNMRLNANAIVTNPKGEILLVKLKKGPFKGGLCIPGGGVEPGELLGDAVRREILEETGIKIANSIRPIGFCEMMHNGVEDHRVIILLHTTSADMPKETEEGNANWFTYEDAGKNLIPFASEAIKMWKENRIYFRLLGDETGITKDWDL